MQTDDVSALRSLSIEMLQLWLLEALTARHSIATSRKPFHIANAGQVRTYQYSQLGDLDAYIARLQAAIDAQLGLVKPVGGALYNGLGF
jgi:hypothetical protein